MIAKKRKWIPCNRGFGDDLVWADCGLQRGLETVCFGRELSDLWNVNTTLLNKKSRSQNSKNSILTLCNKYMHKNNIDSG